MSADLDALRQSNADRIALLRMQGVEPNPLAVFQLQLDHLIETLLPSGPIRKKYLLACERAIEELIVQAEQMLARAKLTAGVEQAPPSQLHLPGSG